MTIRGRALENVLVDGKTACVDELASDAVGTPPSCAYGQERLPRYTAAVESPIPDDTRTSTWTWGLERIDTCGVRNRKLSRGSGIHTAELDMCGTEVESNATIHCGDKVQSLTARQKNGSGTVDNVSQECSVLLQVSWLLISEAQMASTPLRRGKGLPLLLCCCICMKTS